MGIEVKRITCSGCGAPLEMPQSGAIRKIKCPYCDTETIISNAEHNLEILNKRNILGGLKFDMLDAGIHHMIIEMLSMASSAPLDVYENCVVKSVNKIIIPAYWFDNCTGMGTAQFEKGMEKEYNEIVGQGEYMHSEKRYRTEWFPMSSAVSATSDFVVSGNKEYSSLFETLYSNIHSPNIIDVEQLDYPADCITPDYDIPDAVVFNTSVKALMENTVREQANRTVGGNKIRNLQITGISIQKGDVRRISVGIYEIVVEYGGTDYKLYLSNNGSTYTYTSLPSDQNRQLHIDQINQAIKDADTSRRKILLGTTITLAVLGLILLIFIVGVVFLIAALVVGLVFYMPVEKEYRAKKKELEAEMNSLMGEFSTVKQNFKDRKVALAGVLNHVSGDPEAF